MRLPVALLSVVAVPASVLAAPVVTPPTPAPRAVAPQVHELALPVEQEAVAPGAVAHRTLVSTPQQRTEPFSTVGVTWQPDAATGELRVHVRTRSEGAWTPWTPLEAEGPEVLEGAPEERRRGVRAGTEPLYAGPSDAVQVRVEVLSGEAPRDLRLALVDPGTSPADATAGTSPVPVSTADAAVAKPLVRSRAEWGADESIRSGSPSYASTLSAVTLHHTASSNDYTADEVPSLLRGFYAYHVKSQGWSDIGYNVLVDKFGRAWEGRAGGLDRPVIGAHAGGFNTGTVGVSMIGTYSTVEPTAATKETVAQVAAWKLGLHGRDPKSSVTLTSGGSTRYSSGTSVTLPRIFGHRDVSTTACPGDRGMAALPGLRERAAAIQASAPTTPPTAEPDPTPTPTPTPSPSPAPDPTAPPAPPARPFGAVDGATATFGSIRVTGWTIDPDAPVHTGVEVRVDGDLAGTAVARGSRPDLAAHFPQYSTDHGYDVAVTASSGPHEVCVTALDAPGTQHVVLGCRTVEVPSGDPLGVLERARATTDVLGVRVTGWSFDPDGAASSPVVLRVDATEVRRVVADLPRVDVAAAVGDSSGRRGFDLVVPAAPGARKVCAVAVNQGLGADKTLGCLDVDVPSRPAPTAPPGSRPVDDSCPAGVPAGGFGDTATSVHRAAVDCAVWWQLTAGVTAERYDPSGRLTRGQVASFLARLLTAAGATLPASPPDAFDDDRGSPHELAINQVAALGVVGGKGARRYEPGGTVTRGQMASYLVRAYEQHVGAPLPDGGDWYADDDGSVHEQNVGRAARAGFTGGTGPGRYAPLALTDRGQVASFLTRLLDMLVEHGRAPRRG